MKPSQPFGLMFKLVAVLAAMAFCIIAVLATGCEAFGARAKGARLARMSRSPAWRAGHFENPGPLDNHFWRSIADFSHRSPEASPRGRLPVSLVDTQTFVAIGFK